MISWCQLTSFGHPKMEKGKIPEENQVSRTSSSNTHQHRLMISHKKKDSALLGSTLHQKGNGKGGWGNRVITISTEVCYLGEGRFCLLWRWSASRLSVGLLPLSVRSPSNDRLHPLNTDTNTEHDSGSLPLNYTVFRNLRCVIISLCFY